MVNFPTHQAGNLLDVGLCSSQELVAAVESLGYLSTSDHVTIKLTLVGPKRDNVHSLIVGLGPVRYKF